MLSLPVLQHCGITRTIQPKLRPENVNKRLTGEKCELLLPSAFVFFKIREKYMELRIKYLQWLYRARSFVSHAKRSSKASEELRTLQKQQVLKDTPQGSNPITDPEEDEEEENEGDPEGGYANEERLTRVLALRAPVETRWNSWYYMIERYGDIL